MTTFLNDIFNETGGIDEAVSAKYDPQGGIKLTSEANYAIKALNLKPADTKPTVDLKNSVPLEVKVGFIQPN